MTPTTIEEVFDPIVLPVAYAIKPIFQNE